MDMEDFRRTKTTVSPLNYHFVFCPRYRRKIFLNEQIDLCNGQWQNFVALHHQEVARLEQHSNKQMRWYVAYYRPVGMTKLPTLIIEWWRKCTNGLHWLVGVAPNYTF